MWNFPRDGNTSKAPLVLRGFKTATSVVPTTSALASLPFYLPFLDRNLTFNHGTRKRGNLFHASLKWFLQRDMPVTLSTITLLSHSNEQLEMYLFHYNAIISVLSQKLPSWSADLKQGFLSPGLAGIFLTCPYSTVHRLSSWLFNGASVPFISWWPPAALLIVLCSKRSVFLKASSLWAFMAFLSFPPHLSQFTLVQGLPPVSPSATEHHS